MLGVLLRKLMDWALSVHLILFSDRPPGGVFSESAQMMRGRRMALLAKLGGWAVLRLVAGVVVAALGAGLVAALTPVLGGNLRLAVMLVVTALGLVMVLDALVSSVANGMLAAILYHLFKDVTGGTPARTTPAQIAAIPMRAILATACVLVFAGLAGGGVILDRIRLPDTTVVIAHRGAAGARPENTLAAVEKAIEDRADWIEIDVQETAEGEVVVLHDSDFMKLAGNDLKIWDATRAELDGIDIGSWFDPAYADQRVPSLRDVLLTARGRAKVLIELKFYGHDERLEQRVSDIIDQTEMSAEIALMSLKYAAVEKMHALRPDLRVGVLAARAAGNLARLDGAFLALNTGMISTRLLREAHGAGKDVYVWTVNDPVAMSRFISMGVDGLITDEPARARQVLADRAGMSVPERLLLWFSHRLGLTAASERRMRDEAS
ncbi:MAG: glycerophosphodiester phosphodiesterase family protein [Pseudomonadota bacterium]